MIDVDELVERAQAALEAGDRLAARGYWRRASRIAPDRLDIWLDLCQVTERPVDRERCLKHIVELDPDNAQARAELAEWRAQLRAQAATQETAASAPPGQERPYGRDNGRDRALPAEGTALAGTGTSAGGIAPAAEGLPAEGSAIGMRPDVTEEMRRQWDEAMAAGRPLVCIDHPHRETTLRCNRCGAPICTQCAVRTPVGLRCKECIKAQQAIFFNAQWYDYPIAALVSVALSIPAAVLAGMAGWWFALIISPLAGGLIAGIVHWAIGRRRGRWTWLAVAACVVLGALVALAVRPFAFIPIAIYAVLAASAAVGTLRLGKSR
jgi:hypothetical protein